MSPLKSSNERNRILSIKLIHVFCNLVLVATAAGALYFTIRALIEGPHSELHLVLHYEPVKVYVILAAAVILIGISSLSVFSLARLSLNALLTSLAALIMYLVATMSYAIAVIVLSKYTPEGPLFHQLHKEVSEYKKHDKHVDALQTALSCCGVKSIADYLPGVIPPSCCGVEQDCMKVENVKSNGCFHALHLLITHYGWVILSVLLFLSIIEIIIFITSYVLCKEIKESKHHLPEGTVKIPRPKAGENPDVPDVVTEEPKKVEEAPQETKEEPKVEEPKEEAENNTETN